MANILMVRAATIPSGDTNLRTRLQNQGHTVTDISSATDPAPHLPGKNLVIITQSADVIDAGFITQYRNAAVPLFTARSQLTYDLRLGTLAAYTSGSQTAVDIGAVGHPLAAGKTGTVQTFPTAQFAPVLNTTEIPTTATKVINRNASTALWHVWEFASGAAMADGFSAPSYRAAWLLQTSQANSNWTAELFDLFDAVISRALAVSPDLVPPLVTREIIQQPSSSTSADGVVKIQWSSSEGAVTYDVGIAEGLDKEEGFTILASDITSPREFTHSNRPVGDYTYGVRPRA